MQLHAIALGLVGCPGLTVQRRGIQATAAVLRVATAF